MNKISIINQKGGSGKTSTAVNLSYYLSSWGYKVLLIDIDPQGNATTHLGIQCKKTDPSTYNFLKTPKSSGTYTYKDICRNSHGIDLIPANSRLSYIESLVVKKTGSEYLLSDSILAYEETNRYDYIIIDTPSWPGYLNKIVFNAVDSYVVSADCKFLATKGCEEAVRSGNIVRSMTPGATCSLLGVLPTFYNASKNASKKTLASFKEIYGSLVFDPIRDNTKLSEAPGFGLPIELFDKKCAGASDYRRFSEHVLDKTVIK